MNCEIISVGTELLLGQILNTDAKFISEKLSLAGIDVFYQTNVGDNEKRLKECLKIAISRSDIIILTGGLGPTMDDLTKETVAEFLDVPLLEDKSSREMIENYFKRSNREITENNFKQALFPKDSVILPNPNGTAPGCILKRNNKIIVILPGPPSELEPMFENYVLPSLKKYSQSTIISRTIKIFGLGESKVETMVKDLLLSSNPTVAPLIGEGFVTLRITAKSDNKENALSMLDEMESKLRGILRDYIFGIDNDTLENIVIKLLKKRNLTLSVAESCTGGMLSSKIVDVPGASEAFKFSAITYSNEAKQNILHISPNTLDKYGAVSYETAKDMAINVKDIAKTDYGISTTGIAGPDGGTKEKPVGLVYIGLAFKDKFYIKRLILSGNRQKIRLNATLNAIDMLRRHLEGVKIDY